MKTIGNILWFLFTGLWTGLTWFVTGLLWCVTIVGIPFGLQAFKLGRLSFWPMGTEINKHFGAHPIANILWFIFGGFALVIEFVVLGLVWCVTIIGIPFGLQAFKLAGLALCPFGATFGKKGAQEKKN